MRKGIILAGGLGKRLMPLTKIISKQLLPIYNKPMIYYPLSTLINIGIKEILLISDRKNIPIYKSLFGDGKKLNLKISYKTQLKPDGIASALILAKKFLKNSNCVLILGDNIFYGTNTIKQFKKANKYKYSSLFTYEVKNPNEYGVYFVKNKKRSIIEKPDKKISNSAVVGIYFYDKNAHKHAKKLKFSKRKELEITDLNNKYLESTKTRVIRLDAETAWLDTGTFDGLVNASNFIKTLEERQGIKIGDLKFRS